MSAGAFESDQDDPLVPVFIPPLVTMLYVTEQKKGRPLTEQEVLELRDGCVCMMLPLSKARRMAESRGDDDIDPENVWEEWRIARDQIAE